MAKPVNFIFRCLIYKNAGIDPTIFWGQEGYGNTSVCYNPAVNTTYVYPNNGGINLAVFGDISAITGVSSPKDLKKAQRN